MAFIVENGSGMKGATSYGKVADFEAYMTDRGIDITGWSTADKQSSLVKATDYIDTRWGMYFKGRRYWRTLSSRSIFTLTNQPSDGETVTVGTAVATFKTTATLDTHAEIGDTLFDTLNNLAAALAAADPDTDGVISSFLIADPDNAELTVYTVRDGVATTETVTNGSFDNATSTGWTRHQQPLEFPRMYLYDKAGNAVEGVPDRLKEATYEYAYRAKTAALAPDPTVDATGLQVTGSRKKIGPIETDVKYAENSTIRITKPYPAADKLLQEYVAGRQIIRN